MMKSGAMGPASNGAACRAPTELAIRPSDVGAWHGMPSLDVPTRVGRWLIVVALAALVGVPQPATAQLRCQPPTAIAQSAMDGATGDLAFEAVYSVDAAIGGNDDEDEDEGDGSFTAGIRLRLPHQVLQLVHGPEDRAQVCIAIVAETSDGLLSVHDETFTATRLDDARSFEYGVDLALSGDTEMLVAVLELPALGIWGAIAVDESDTALPPRPAEARALGDPDGAWYRIVGALPERMVSAPNSATALQLVPPRRQPVAGSTRVYALASTPDVARVVFLLDGQEVGERSRPPFFASVPFERPARPQTLRAVAYDRGSRELGASEILVNPRDAPFRVRIRDLEGDPAAGSAWVEADVEVPLGAHLDRVEIFLNATSVARLEQPPFRARVTTPSTSATDFIRVAAFLDDGRSIDDVVLLSDPSLVEAVDVNLVPLYVVVHGADGRPVTGLGTADFRLTVGGQPHAIETFSVADDVPLVIGLVVDTSGSMSLVMEDTRRAAVGFLQGIVGDADRGFVVDFDRQPRLRQETTSDMIALMRALGALTARGETSLYDAIVFSMLQFEREGARRALVVLTDGVDLESRFGPRDCVDYGQRLGVPIYLIAMQTFGDTNFPERQLRRITEGTGGGFYLIGSIGDLPATYAAIEHELRSQYALGFYTEEDLGAEARRDIEVEVAGAKARVVIGSGGTP